MLDTVFMRVLDMSKTASIVILVVLVARLMLKKAPKIFSYALWAVVLFRLLCPFSLEAQVSLVPEITSVSEGYDLSEEPISVLGAGEAAYQAVGDALNGGLGVQHIRTTEKSDTGMTRYVTTDWWSVWILFGQYVWVAGMAVMLLHSAASYLRLRKKLLVAVPLRDTVFIADDIGSPFVIGLFRPKIYLPGGLEEREQAYIILHEQHHIKRFDHLIKLAAFFSLAIHWFNPLVWAAFILASRDMEMSCDEAVIRRLGSGVRAEYSASLLTLATGRRIIAGSPLAFGEGDTKGRIRNLAKWKKPAAWVVAAAMILCAALTVCLLTDPNRGHSPELFSDETEKNYVYEFEGILGDFTITLRRDGTFNYYEGMASSYIGRGTWEQNGDILTLTDDAFQNALVNRFRIDGEDLIFIGDGSSNFIYVKVQSGARFRSGTVNLWAEEATDPERDDTADTEEPQIPSADPGTTIFHADLDHDGTGEEIRVRETEEGWLYEISVVEEDVVLWSKELSVAHAGWGTIMLCSKDGSDYLAEYYPYVNNGLGGYTCRAFSLRDGAEITVEEWSVQFKVPCEETGEMKEFAREVGLLLRNCTVLLSTERGILVDTPAAAATLPQIYPVRFDSSEIDAAINGVTVRRELTDKAAQLPDTHLTFVFTSGVGAWSTVLTLQPDGSFIGSYRDADVGNVGEGYPNGTHHVCEFSGEFMDIQQISDHAWLMKLSDLTTERPQGEVWIENEVMYVAAEAFGLSGGNEFLLYAPGTPADEMLPGALSWWPDYFLWRSGAVETLDGWALCGVSSGAGFFTSWLTAAPW